jgi:EAL domain-containing protein (putative c-di-GMP-specific phosphodiesterase class I)
MDLKYNLHERGKRQQTEEEITEQIRQERVRDYFSGDPVKKNMSELRILPHYQMKADAESGKPHGAEALIRMTDLNSPKNKIQAPTIIKAVESDLRLQMHMTRAMICSAIEDVSNFVAASRNPNFRVWVNVSPDLLGKELQWFTHDQLDRAGVDPRHFGLEILESSRPKNIDSVRELVSNGVAVALDDIGGKTQRNKAGEMHPKTIGQLASIYGVKKLKMDRATLLSPRLYSAIPEIVNGHGLEVTVEGVEHAHDVRAMTFIARKTRENTAFGRTPLTDDDVRELSHELSHVRRSDSIGESEGDGTVTVQGFAHGNSPKTAYEFAPYLQKRASVTERGYKI